jgi:8-oxo-dGTP pyrophosphatase MutT (NUDIX family)
MRPGVRRKAARTIRDSARRVLRSLGMPNAFSPLFTLDSIRQALSLHSPQPVDSEPRDRAASVALVLAGGSELSLCVIRRADRADDPWSGHLAFPGGRRDPDDRDNQHTAERETLEEVGLDLGGGELLGALSQVLVRSQIPGWRMVLSPFVYALAGEPPPFATSDEVAAAYWVPLRELWNAANASRFDWDREDGRRSYPAVRVGDSMLWGLSFRVLTLFSDVLDAPLPHLEDAPGLGL